jgi:hypothetical protein
MGAGLAGLFNQIPMPEFKGAGILIRRAVPASCRCGGRYERVGDGPDPDVDEYRCGGCGHVEYVLKGKG